MCRMDWNEKMQKDEKKLYFKAKVTSSWVKIVGIWMRIKFKKEHKEELFFQKFFDLQIIEIMYIVTIEMQYKI